MGRLLQGCLQSKGCPKTARKAGVLSWEFEDTLMNPKTSKHSISEASGFWSLGLGACKGETWMRDKASEAALNGALRKS